MSNFINTKIINDKKQKLFMERKGINFTSLLEIFLIVLAANFIATAAIMMYHRGQRKKRLKDCQSVSNTTTETATPV